MQSSSIIIVEIGGSHDECLLTQMHAIKKHGHKIILICTNNIKNRNPEFIKYVDKFHIIELTRGKIHNFFEVRNIWKIIRNSKVKTVIFNTAQGNNIRMLCLFALFNKVKFVGIVHTTLKFKKSFTQKIINLKIKKYLLLSEYLLSTIKPPKDILINYFYPIHFPSFNKKIEKENAIITIIGGVENQRRDLSGLFQMILNTKNINASFVFLGKTIESDKEVILFRKNLKSQNLHHKIITYSNYVDHETFDAQLNSTDLILPLVHPNTPSANQYFKNQISGAMSISFGYKIPLLIHESYANIDEMKKASFYYNKETFPETLAYALKNHAKKRQAMLTNNSFDSNHQEDRYYDFIFSEAR